MNERYALCRGFSLIELTVVLLLITLIASVAVRETSELAFQTRYEQTKERLEMIKQAILGNPRQIINGQQAISGFVADMGRLPVDLHELLEREYCSDRTYATKTDCTTNGATWNVGPPYDAYHCTVAGYYSKTECETNSGTWEPNLAGMAVGWRGPYLAVNQNATDADAFPDAWGNQATDATDHKYGWRFDDLFAITANAADSGNLIIQSQGKNQQLDNSIPAVEDYDADYPINLFPSGTTYYPKPAILQKDWLVDISGGITVNLLKPYRSLGGFCGFLDSQASSFPKLTECKNAGGFCLDTSPADGNCDSTCTINSLSCKSLGGKWQSCFFTSAQCISFTGGTWQESCEFTPLSCAASGGTWNTATRICDFTSATCPASATWNGSKCVFSENSCFTNRGNWQKQCKFSNQTDCEKSIATGGPGGTWELEKPESCRFTITQCNAAGGLSIGKDCDVTNQEGVSSPVTRYSQQNCNNSSGSWRSNIKQVCLNVFYRNNGLINWVSSLPTLIEENGAYQAIQFTFSTSPIFVPSGQNAISIYEFTDNDSDGIFCEPGSDNLYPADRQSPIQVDFHPHTTLPVINW